MKEQKNTNEMQMSVLDREKSQLLKADKRENLSCQNEVEQQCLKTKRKVICARVCQRELTVVHEAAVTEPHTQRHSILSGRAVSLGNHINDAHRRSATMPVYTFTYTTHSPITCAQSVILQNTLLTTRLIKTVRRLIELVQIC